MGAHLAVKVPAPPGQVLPGPHVLGARLAQSPPLTRLLRWQPWLVSALLFAFVVLTLRPFLTDWHPRQARDFASFYHAVGVAFEGGDPYDPAALEAHSLAQGTGRGVNPYFYPPPFLLSVLWTLPLDYNTAWKAWYLMDHVFLLLALLALWRWHQGGWRTWRALPSALLLMALTFAPLGDEFRLGQVNLMVLAVSAWGLLLAERGRERLGGALLGLACMFKMSPALLVAWWLLHRRWRPVLSACAAALLLSLAALPLVGPAEQLRFFTQVLPGFGAGAYHGLQVPIGMQGNHSLPNLLQDAFPGATDFALSPSARRLSLALSLGLLAASTWRLRLRDMDTTRALCQVGLVVVFMLLLPVYTFQHHLVWLLVPGAALLLALTGGQLRREWRFPLALAWLALALPDAAYDQVRYTLGLAREPLYYLLREARFLAMLALGAACWVAARTPRDQPGALPGPGGPDR